MTEEKENCNFQQNYNVFGLDDKPCCYLYHKYCNEIDSCYFKRCKHLEQEVKHWQMECKEAKAKGEWTYDLVRKKVDRLEQENKQIKSVLEEINRVVKLAHKVEDYLLGQDYTDLVDRIEKEVNEVLK